MTRTILTNVNIIDATRKEPSHHSAIVIRGGIIENIIPNGSKLPKYKNSRLEDLEDAWILPGLIDSHNHMISPLAPYYFPDEHIIDRYIRQGRETMDALKVGFTTLRVVGAANFSDVAWKRTFDNNLFQGPKLFVAGHALAPTAGHGLHMKNSIEMDGSEGFRKGVREQLQGGADFVKILMTGGVMGNSWDDPDHSHFMADELQAVVDIANSRGYKVAAHAANPDTVKMAVRAGVYSIEHGYTLDEESVQLMVDNGTYYNPTFCITHLTPQAAENPYQKAYIKKWPLREDLQKRADDRRGKHLEAFKMALDAGVRIGSGCDAGPLKDTGLLEIELLVQNGMNTHDALKAATLHGAALCQMEDQIGTVEIGKQADLVVLTKNPLENIHNIRSTCMVFKNGQIVSDLR